MALYIDIIEKCVTALAHLIYALSSHSQ